MVNDIHNQCRTFISRFYLLLRMTRVYLKADTLDFKLNDRSGCLFQLYSAGNFNFLYPRDKARFISLQIYENFHGPNAIKSSQLDLVKHHFTPIQTTKDGLKTSLEGCEKFVQQTCQIWSSTCKKFIISKKKIEITQNLNFMNNAVPFLKDRSPKKSFFDR